MNAKSLGFKKSGLPHGVNFPLCMAPMVGLSHSAFRQLVREYLPEDMVTLWPSEMLNSRRLPHEKLHKIPEAIRSEDENFWIPQILANEEEKIRLSLEKLFDHGAQGIDINMGCPVQKALKHNYGVSLMGDADYAANVVAMTAKYSQGPVSVKLRAVESDKKADWIQFVKGLESAGAHWICLHPRTAEQKRKGKADWSQIKELTQNINIPVIGNGDIQTVEDILSMPSESQCDMVMAGRVLTARPWLFWQLGEKIGLKNPKAKEGKAPQTPEEEAQEYGQSLLRLLTLMEQDFQERLALRKFIFHVKTGCVWLPFGHTLYAMVDGAKSFSELRGIVEKFFSHTHQMSLKTDLRQ